jgi:hypothetical protein
LKARGTRDAELREKYFSKIKFSTQVLISMWKMGSHSRLTALSSTACSCLHNFSAAHFLHGAVFARARSWSKRKARKIKSLRGLNTKILAAQCSARLNFTLRKNY